MRLDAGSMRRAPASMAVTATLCTSGVPARRYAGDLASRQRMSPHAVAAVAEEVVAEDTEGEAAEEEEVSLFG